MLPTSPPASTEETLLKVTEKNFETIPGVTQKGQDILYFACYYWNAAWKKLGFYLYLFISMYLLASVRTEFTPHRVDHDGNTLE